MLFSIGQSVLIEKKIGRAEKALSPSAAIHSKSFKQIGGRNFLWADHGGGGVRSGRILSYSSW